MFIVGGMPALLQASIRDDVLATATRGGGHREEI
jgi:hypothetical protein